MRTCVRACTINLSNHKTTLNCLVILFYKLNVVLFLNDSSHSWYGDYVMNVLLSTTLGASQDSVGEHGSLLVAVGNALTAQQTGKMFHATTLRVLLCEYNTSI